MFIRHLADVRPGATIRRKSGELVTVANVVRYDRPIDGMEGVLVDDDGGQHPIPVGFRFYIHTPQPGFRITFRVLPADDRMACGYVDDKTTTIPRAINTIQSWLHNGRPSTVRIDGKTMSLRDALDVLVTHCPTWRAELMNAV